MHPNTIRPAIPARRRLAAVACLALATWLMAAPGAGAALRDEPLEATCDPGYSYGEHTFQEWTVEGCSTAGRLEGDETVRRRFRGEVEVNGMLLVPAERGVDLVATVSETSSDGTTTTTARLERARSTRIVVDPLIGGVRRRITLHTGTIDLSVVDGVTIHEGPGTRDPLAGASIVGTEEIELPLSGAPSLLGLRVRDSSLDATLTRDSIELDVGLSLGSAAPGLLRDWIDDVGVELVDGQGMRIDELTLRLPDIAIPGIGGLENFRISYDGGRDVWSGTVKLDLGDLFPVLDFETEVSASDGAVLYIRAAASNMSIPIGATGITLDAVEAEFGLDPLMVGAGVGVTAGPVVAGVALLDADGALEILLEPSFRLTASGVVRILPTGSGQLARGDIGFIYDSDGYISLDGDANFEATVAGVGIGAEIGGSGAYATDRNRFNIEAHATGELLLGVLGDYDVVRLEAVVSSDGWGACGELIWFLTGGVGQQWGRNIDVISGCDLTPYSDPIAGASIAQRGAIRSRTFRVAPGTRKLAIELTSDRPGARVRLLAPGGAPRLQTDERGRVMADRDAIYFASDTDTRQYVFLRHPRPGSWTVQWRADEPQITALRTARDVAPLRARARVERAGGPGGRRLRVGRVRGLYPGERLMVGIETKRGMLPVGDVASARGAVLAFDERGRGRRRIIAQVVRDGMPIPGRRAVLGSYRATLPSRPARLKVRRRGARLELKALAGRSAESPDAWHYAVGSRAGSYASLTAATGHFVRLPVRASRAVTVTVRPVLDGRVLAGRPTRRTIRIGR